MSNVRSEEINKKTIVLVGAAGTGKTSFLNRIKDEPEKFSEGYNETIGAELDHKTFFDKHLKLTIWAIAGAERFRAVAKTYYRQADAIILFYDVMNRESFNALPYFIKDLEGSVSKDCKLYLTGTKADLAPNGRAVTQEEAAEFAKNNNLVWLNEVSAKEDYRVNDVMAEMATSLVEDNNAELENAVDSQNHSQLTPSFWQHARVNIFAFWQRYKPILIGIAFGIAVAGGFALAATFLWPLFIGISLVAAVVTTIAIGLGTAVLIGAIAGLLTRKIEAHRIAQVASISSGDNKSANMFVAEPIAIQENSSPRSYSVLNEKADDSPNANADASPIAINTEELKQEESGRTQTEVKEAASNSISSNDATSSFVTGLSKTEFLTGSNIALSPLAADMVEAELERAKSSSAYMHSVLNKADGAADSSNVVFLPVVADSPKTEVEIEQKDEAAMLKQADAASAQSEISTIESLKTKANL